MKKSIAYCLILISFLIGIQTSAQSPFFKTYSNGSDTNYVFESVAETYDNHLMAVGYKVYCISGSAQCYGEGIVMKTDASGHKIWEKSYSIHSGKDLSLYDIIPAEDKSGFIICGLGDEPASAELDFYVAKIDHDGNVIWQNNYGTASSRDWAYEVRSTPDSCYVVCGWSAENNNNLSILKISGSGAVLWQKDFGTMDSEYGYTVAVTQNNAILAAGSSGDMSRYGYVVKTDANGDTLWTKTYEGIYEIRSIVNEDDGNFTISGFVSEPYSSAFLAKCDSLGNLIWLKKYMDTYQTWSADHKKVPGGGYVLATIRNGSADYDFNIIRTDDTGAITWQRMAHAANDYAKTIICLSDSSFLVSGNSGNKATLLKIGQHGEPAPLSNFIFENDLSKKMKIYPNPASHFINLDYNDHVRIQSIQLTDVLGRKVRDFGTSEKILNVSGLPGGMYFLNIRAEEGKLSEKILIQ